MRLQSAIPTIPWLTQRNLVFSVQERSLSREAVTYCLVSLALRPREVPVEVIEALVQAGYLKGVDCYC